MSCGVVQQVLVTDKNSFENKSHEFQLAVSYLLHESWLADKKLSDCYKAEPHPSSSE